VKTGGRLVVTLWVLITGLSLVAYGLFRLGGPLPPEDEFRVGLEKELSRVSLEHLGRREVLSYCNGRLRTNVAIAFDLYDNPAQSHGPSLVRKVTSEGMQAIIKVLTDRHCDPRSRKVDIVLKARFWTPPSPTGRRQASVAGIAHYDHRNDQVTFSYGDSDENERWERARD